MSPYLEKILVTLDETKADWRELFNPPFSVKEVLELLKDLIQVAESVITSPGSGEDKHAVVKEAFLYLDEQYQLVDKMDDAIKLPFYLEPFDGKLIRAAIDLLIVAMVKVFNATIWK
ncbi:MAG: hypothetical protein EHM79_00345 [Geobacter sp.]|nr:MAG: hypothetical protein EHM79_00345 [Geobacter sp.]